MKLIDLLEAVDLESAYSLSSPNIRIRNPRSNIVSYKFKSKSGSEYSIDFYSNYSGPKRIAGYKTNWTTDCSYEDGRGLVDTDDNDSLRILATVLKASYDFIKEFKPEMIEYSGILSKKEEKSSDEEPIQSKRVRINNILIEKNLNKIPDYKFIKEGDISYLIYKGETPIKGAHKIFKYPKEVPNYSDLSENKKIKW